MRSSSRPRSNHHRRLALLTLALAVLLFLSPKSLHQPHDGSHHIVLCEVGPQDDTGLDVNNLTFPQELKALPAGFKASLEVLDDPHKEHILKRALSYDAAICDGRYMFGLVREGGTEKRPGAFTNTEDLETYKWNTVDKPLEFPAAYVNVFHKLGVSTEAADNARIQNYQNEKTLNANHKEISATYAEYEQIYNIRGHTIIAASNYSPSYTLRRGDPSLTGQALKDKTPALSNWAEVVWLQWKVTVGDQAGNLKYVFRQDISNADTVAVMDAVAEVERGSFDSPFPGIELLPESDGFLALLGTPNGRGVGYLIANHRDGIRTTFKSVTMFTNRTDIGGRSYQLLFTLGD